MGGVRASTLIPAAAGIVLFIAGCLGAFGDGWGYGLLLVCAMLLLAGTTMFAVFVFSHRFEDGTLKGAFTWLFYLGAWAYVLGVCALGGFYVAETIAGRMELKWILFGPSAIAALIVLDYGLYRLLVKKNLPTWARYRQFISRAATDPASMRRTFLDDVVLHRALFSVSGFRWLRHTLIFWGFVLMFALELVAVFLREGIPAFGFRDIWEEHGNPVRLAFDFGFDFFGLMVLVGCVLALIYRVMVNGTEDQKYTDTPTAVFLLLVVASGFVVEAMRIESMPGEYHLFSFAGYFLSSFIPAANWLGSTTYEFLWLAHVLGSCLFIAYVPIKRLVHSCATPMGRLMHSQKGMLAAKREAVLRGLQMNRQV
jgi:nitrate reductase gamma subunit